MCFSLVRMTGTDRRVLLLLLVGATAAWMNLASLHESEHADSLLLVLVSTQRWTPFYWGQDRFGMLLPLLAMPVRQPVLNMVVQGFLSTVAVLLALRSAADLSHCFAHPAANMAGHLVGFAASAHVRVAGRPSDSTRWRRMRNSGEGDPLR